MTSKSKAKGNRAETWLAAELTTWYGQPFHRIPASGALRWNDKIWAYGDILPPADFPFVIESKHNKAADLNGLLYQAENNLIDWWWRHQVLPDVTRAVQGTGNIVHPMLVWTGNYTKTHICLSQCLVRVLIGIDATYDTINRLDVHIGGQPVEQDYAILPFAAFLKINTHHFRSAFLRFNNV